MPKVKGGRPTKSDKRSSVTNKKVGNKPEKKTTKKVNKEKKPQKLKKESRALTVVTPGQEVIPAEYKEVAKKARLTKKRLNALKKMNKDSQFSIDLPDIVDLIDGSGSIDDVEKKFLTSALMVVVNLIPEIERQLHIKQNESGTYALKALLAEGREIFHSIRALANTQLIAFRIAESVIDPQFTNLGNMLVQILHAIRAGAEELVEPENKPALRQLFQDQTRIFGEEFNKICAEIKEQIAQEIE